MITLNAASNGTPLALPGALLPNADSPLHFMVWDMETARDPKSVPGGWEEARKGAAGLSAAAVYDSQTNWTYLYGSDDLLSLAATLEGADVVVTYNGEGFDNGALAGLIGRPLRLKAHIDLFAMLMKANGNQMHGFGLDRIANHTLGYGKPIGSEGKHAPDLYERGLLGGEEGVEAIFKMLTYCGNDVRLTRDLLLFAKQHGFLVGPRGPIHIAVPDWWKRLT